MEHYPLVRALVALAAGVAAGFISLYMRFLTPRGALAAGVLAALLVGLGSWPWLVPMLLFFLTSSLLTRACERLRPESKELFAKGGERDAAQVLANGGIGGLLVVVAQWHPGNELYAAYLGSLAAATADTWGTEIGLMFGGSPRMITTMDRVPRGTSGAVSAAGLAGGALGACLVASCAVLWMGKDAQRILFAAAAAGCAGSVADSLLGALAQAQFRCPSCGRLTERETHCGVAVVRVRGARWLNNDRVNLAANAFASLAAFLLSFRGL